jgi:hypothetical protein
MNAETLRLLLTGYLLAMFVLALTYLRRRPLTWVQFSAWGFFALLVPALGPFLVIVAQPGKTNWTRTSADQRRNTHAFRVSPPPVHRTRADIVRARRKR